MRQSCIWDEEISTPKGLQRALENPILRRRYILDADVKVATLSSLVFNAHPKTGEVKEETDGKRRIDYILHNKDVDIVSIITLFVNQRNETYISFQSILTSI